MKRWLASRPIFIIIFGFLIEACQPESIEGEGHDVSRFTVENHGFDMKSEIAAEDDPFARSNYEINLQIDPETRKIPAGIFQRERLYVDKLPVASSVGPVNLRKKQDLWAPLGPENLGGRTRAFAVDVLDNDVLVAGSVSGSMWRSENSGQTWEVTSSPSFLVGASVVVQDTRPGKENIWYYGTGEIRGNSQRAPGAPYRGDGIFKSIDGARSWFPLNSTRVPVLSFFNSQFNYIHNMIVNHRRSDIDEIYAAAYGGILRSQDGGETWSAVLGDELFDLDLESDLNGVETPFFTEIELSQGGIFYAYLSEFAQTGYNESLRGVFRSTDGENWLEITPENLPDSANRAVMAVAPTNEDIMYMFVHHGLREDDDKAEQSLWKYTHEDPVGTWEDLTANIPKFGGDVGDMDTQNSFNMVVEVHPNDENIVFLGGTNLYRSLDGFSSLDNLEWIGGYDTTNDVTQYPGHHADQHNLVFLKEAPFRLYSAHDEGISFSDASTIVYPQWTSLSNAYIASQFYAIAIQMDESNDIIVGGTQDNGSWFGLSNELNPWLKSLGGDGAYSAVSSGARFVYASAQRGRVFRFIPDFENQQLRGFTRVDPANAATTPDQGYLFVNPFILDPNNTDRMFVAGGDAIWRNQNLVQIPLGNNDKATEGWERMESTIVADTGQISSLVASIDIPNRLYYGTSTGLLFRIDSAHIGGGQVLEITDDDFPGGNIICINVNPEDAEEVLVVFSNYAVLSIFRSTNGGLDFEPIGGNLEEFEDGEGDGPSLRWATIVPMSDGSYRYYVGTSSGLFMTSDLGGMDTEWVRQAPNTIGRAIVNMLSYRPLDGRLVAATHGNGVYSTEIEGFKLIDPPSSVPQPFSIDRPYPNPFSDQVTVSYSLPEDAIVLARVFNLTGDWIKTVLWGTQTAGSHQLSWNGTNNFGQSVPEGVYVMSLLSEGRVAARKVILSR